jgi:hypothetical protein
MPVVEDGLGSEKEKGDWICLINWLGLSVLLHRSMAMSDAGSGVTGFRLLVCDDGRLRTQMGDFLV